MCKQFLNYVQLNSGYDIDIERFQLNYTVFSISFRKQMFEIYLVVDGVEKRLSMLHNEKKITKSHLWAESNVTDLAFI